MRRNLSAGLLLPPCASSFDARDSSACDDGVERLLGMDLVRLVLERARTSKEAVEIAGHLIEAHGQGGSCEDGGSWCYENGFLFADSGEAWVFETSGKSWWAAERVGKGCGRNISNGISIRRPDMMHAGLVQHAIAKGWWKGAAGDFDWKLAMLGGSSSAEELQPEGREKAGREWLDKLSGPGKDFSWRDMATILRDTDSVPSSSASLLILGGGRMAPSMHRVVLYDSFRVAHLAQRFRVRFDRVYLEN